MAHAISMGLFDFRKMNLNVSQQGWKVHHVLELKISRDTWNHRYSRWLPLVDRLVKVPELAEATSISIEQIQFGIMACEKALPKRSIHSLSLEHKSIYMPTSTNNLHVWEESSKTFATILSKLTWLHHISSRYKGKSSGTWYPPKAPIMCKNDLKLIYEIGTIFGD